MINNKQKGFTLLYAVLVSSIVLSASLSIINIALKQHKLSALSRESQIAFYAANTGVDCALYWNTHDREIVGGAGSIEVFPAVAVDTSYDDPRIDSDDLFAEPLRTDSDPSAVYCLGESIVNSDKFYENNGDSVALDDFYDFTNNSGGSYWDAHFAFGDGDVQEEYCLDNSNLSDYRTWVFQLVLPNEAGEYSKDNACAVVSVCKNLDVSGNGGYNTVYTSKGYNTCDITKENVVERGVRLIQD